MKASTSVPVNTSKNPTIYALAVDCLESGRNFWDAIGEGRNEPVAPPACEKYEWCDGTQHHDATHNGVIASAPTGDAAVTLEASVFEACDDDAASTVFHFDIVWWEINPDDIEREISDLHNMVDTFAAALRKTAAEMEAH